MYRSNNTRNFVENTTRMEQLDYFLSELKALIHKSEDDMAARFGAKIYRSENGFTHDTRGLWLRRAAQAYGAQVAKRRGA